MKRLLVIALLVVGCNQVPTGPQAVAGNGNFSEQDVTLLDGRTIHCLFWGAGQTSQYAIGGLSCDWGNAR